MLNPPSNNRDLLTVSYQAKEPTVAEVDPGLKEESLELKKEEGQSKEAKQKAEAEKKAWEYEEGYWNSLQRLVNEENGKRDEEEVVQALEQISEFLESALEAHSMEGGGEDKNTLKKSRPRRSGGKRDREEIFEQLARLSTQARDKLGSQDEWGVAKILDSVSSGDGQVLSSRQLRYALGNFMGCGDRMWMGWSGGGCDKWRSDA
ncbi:hypothetical protein [Candidatus Mycoplasma haematohominis]|uniref:Uncharacterized protein n=1 Tax=Candidatus Mycoplasma haematohominis TaxID=1494318 RepID=A0A478FSV1_9MOLU|nr:hypothetical protein [Candidatus Mycoplasma haemohominis]GCE63155.1 hypothetical protein MHSWG343_01330 [Candidatus Mycoplasma haemohominis]